MNNEEQVAGVYAVDMSVADLKQLCKENNLDIKGKTSKKDILEVVHAWEVTVSKEMEKKVKKMGGTVTNEKVVEFHEGKLVVSRTPLVLNGVDYEDITVEGGITHRVPVIK